MVPVIHQRGIFDGVDSAREQLDVDIALALRHAEMLEHLAKVVADAAIDVEEGKVYPLDAKEALLSGAKRLRSHRENLEHVRAIYDGMVYGEPS